MLRRGGAHRRCGPRKAVLRLCGERRGSGMSERPAGAGREGYEACPNVAPAKPPSGFVGRGDTAERASFRRKAEASERSSCRRVHIIFTKGSQTVQHFPWKVWYYHHVRYKTRQSPPSLFSQNEALRREPGGFHFVPRGREDPQHPGPVMSTTVSDPSRTVKRTSSPANPKPYTRSGSSW